MSKDMKFEKHTAEDENALSSSEKSKMSISRLLRIAPALEQVKAHKKEGMLGFFGLICLSISHIILILYFSENLFLLQIPDVDVLAFALFFAFVIIGIAYVVFALTKVGKPLKARAVISRLIALTLAMYLITAVKSLALGHLARLLFAGDYTRFEFAKTGVDHASMLFGIVVAALSYSLLSALLREKKLEFKNVGKSFATLIFWVGALYIPTYVISLIFSTHTLEAYLSTGLVVAISLILISSLFPLWFLALSLSFYTLDEGEGADESEEVDADFEDTNEDERPSSDKDLPKDVEKKSS